MFGYMNLHAIAAARGDGLQPELLALLERRHAHCRCRLMSSRCRIAAPAMQAGPVPSGAGMTTCRTVSCASRPRTEFR